MTIPSGKGAMIWKLRNWQNGDPESQVAHAQSLGLDWVSPKIVDGIHEKWEAWWINNQNVELLPDTVAALKDAGIRVIGWGWTYAQNVQQEAELAIEICQKHGMDHFQIDAEHNYRGGTKADEADLYCRILEGGPSITHSLCSYRWPLTHQPDFPVRAFEPYMEAWCPQVYWLGDNRVIAGADQMQRSFDQYIGQIADLPFFPIAPTYDWNGWRATQTQLTGFLQRAVDIGCVGAGIWDLPQASQAQLDAWAAFDWPEDSDEPPPPDPDEPVSIAISGPAGSFTVEVDET